MSNYILSEGEQCESPNSHSHTDWANGAGTQNQLSSLVLQRIRAPTGCELRFTAIHVRVVLISAQHLRLARRRNPSGGQILVSLVESFRPQFKRWWCLRRDSDFQRKDLERSVESSRYVSFKWVSFSLIVSGRAMLRVQDVKHSR
jgi:hypothetical protein